MDERARATDMSDFMIDDVDDYTSEVGEDESNNDDDLFDHVCAFCDNGGDLLCCEGECVRSFHATKEAGGFLCESLGMTDREVEEMPHFVCKNCKYKQHQCFACGKLGSSDKSSGAEVFRCINATCGRFYHPWCVANLLYHDNEVAAKELNEKIAAGEKFACPIHKCSICQQSENKKEVDFQFAVCRRCPTSYHRKCLPREISFQFIEEENILIRAWDGLLPNRVLVYCLKHEMVAEIETPLRDHVKFPIGKEENSTIEEKGKKRTMEFVESREMVLGLPAKKSRADFVNPFSGRIIQKAPSILCPGSFRKAEIFRKVELVSSAPDLSRKFRTGRESTKFSRDNLMSSLMDSDEKSNGTMHKPTFQSRNQDTSSTRLKKPLTAKTTLRKFCSEMVELDSDSEKRLLDLIQGVALSITMKDVVEKLTIPSTHIFLLNTVVDKTITLGKVEATVEAVRTALQKLQDGCNIDDAKAVCEPEVLSQVFKWKNKLKVYLAPFLHSMRYTSFGRHFTKEEKLKVIVDMLHWYVQDGDMVVDFCCGANNFSCLMNKKLEETGKKCSYKNYDIVQPKNDFNFEKRDWMTVHPTELLKEGSQLIMGLNPPFGFKASLANKFIDKALEFRPKLLILIVPPETERLDKKNPPYDLVWEDHKLLSGKSFYLPGSIDTNDKQMDQWNNTPPVLYFWSRHDWSSKHKAIAEKHGHISVGGRSNLGNGSYEIECLHRDDILMSTSDWPKQNKQQENLGCKLEGCQEVLQNGYQHLEPGMSNADGRYGAAYDTTQASTHGNNRMYDINVKPFSHGLSNVEKMESQYTGQLRDGAASNSYGTCVAGLGREMDLKSKICLYGQDPRSYVKGTTVERDPGHGHFGLPSSMLYGYAAASAMDSSYTTNMSATQQYTTRLDELKPLRMNNYNSAAPMYNPNGIYDPTATFHMDPLHFPPGPHNPS